VDVLTMKELLETGVHFGHRTRKWNPKMARYIFTERKGIHIIDLEQTVDLFRKAYYSVRDSVAEGGEVDFVGTKRQVQGTIADEALRCGAHYVNRRWLGGTLTNFATLKLSIDRMKKMEVMIEDGTVDHMPNKEASRLRRRLAKLQRNLDGLRRMDKKPSLMYVIDPDSETIAVHEANLAGIPVIAIVDTNCDPDPIDFLIPGNDDAIKATKLITSRIADAILEGREGRQDEIETAATVTTAEAKADEKATDDEEAVTTEKEETATVESAAEPVETSVEAPEVEAATEDKVEEVEEKPEVKETTEETEDEPEAEEAVEEVEDEPEVEEAAEEVEDEPEVEEAAEEVEDEPEVKEAAEETEDEPEAEEAVEEVEDEPEVEEVAEEAASEDEDEKEKADDDASEVEEDKEKETDDD